MVKRSSETGFNNPTDWITPRILAGRLHTSIQKLANDRHRGKGFPYSKDGVKVLYHWPTCNKILMDQMVHPRQ